MSGWMFLFAAARPLSGVLRAVGFPAFSRAFLSRNQAPAWLCSTTLSRVGNPLIVQLRRIGLVNRSLYNFVGLGWYIKYPRLELENESYFNCARRPASRHVKACLIVPNAWSSS